MSLRGGNSRPSPASLRLAAREARSSAIVAARLKAFLKKKRKVLQPGKLKILASSLGIRGDLGQKKKEGNVGSIVGDIRDLLLLGY